MKISVIIPMYNAQLTLEDAYHSVVEQTYQNIEIILVDNGSTDHTYDIACEIASKDFRVTVLKESMVGVSYARRKGFQNSTGEYVYFMDADDILAVHSLEVFAHIISESHPDMIEARYREFDSSNEIKILKQADMYCDKLFDYSVVPVEELMDIDAGLWCHIYRRDLIQDSFFVPLQQLEDNFFNYYAFLHADKVLHTSKIIYYLNRTNHSIDDNSLSSAKNTIAPIDLFHEFVILFQNYLEKEKLETYEEELQTIMGYLFLILAKRIDYISKVEMKNIEQYDLDSGPYHPKYDNAMKYLYELFTVLDMIQFWHNPYIRDEDFSIIEHLYQYCHPNSSLIMDRDPDSFQKINIRKGEYHVS